MVTNVASVTAGLTACYVHGPPLSPLLDGIDVSEEQQNLPRAAFLPVREEQVVAGDAQGASARRVQRLPENNILHVGRLDVLGKLHRTSNSCLGLQTTSSPARNFETEAHCLQCAPARSGRSADALCLFADKEPINRVISLCTWPVSGATTFYNTQVPEQDSAPKTKSIETTEDGSTRFLRDSCVAHSDGKSFWTLWGQN